MEHHHSLWTDLLAHAGLHVPDEIVMVTLAFVVLTLVAVLGSRKLSVEKPGTFQQLLEVGVGGIVSLLEDIIPHHGRRHLAVIGTFFFLILTSNLFGLVPTLTPPTQSFNITLALAVISFTYYNVVAVREIGAKAHVKHLLGPVLALSVLILPIEIVSHGARNISLSMRLFGNIFGEHSATGVFYTFLGGFLAPLPMMFLGLFGSFLQAFIFTLLSIVYIALATEH